MKILTIPMILLRRSARLLALHERGLTAGERPRRGDDVIVTAFDDMVADGLYFAAACFLDQEYAVLAAHLLSSPRRHPAFAAHLEAKHPRLAAHLRGDSSAADDAELAAVEGRLKEILQESQRHAIGAPYR